MPATRVRLRFAKRGDLRLISHHDLMRCVERMLRRAALPVAHSQGFNPRPKMVFPLALALGIEGAREVLELELAEPQDAEEVRRRLAATAPAGLDFLEAEELGPGRAGQVAAASYALPVPREHADACHAALARFLASDHWTHLRHRPDKGRTRAVDLRQATTEASLDADGVLRFRLTMTTQGSARPEEVVGALGLTDVLTQGGVLVRTDVELASLTPAAPPSPPVSPTDLSVGPTPLLPTSSTTTAP